MAAPDEPDFELAPTRVGGPPGGAGPRRPGRGRLRIALVLVAAVAVPAIAVVGPRIEWRPEIDLSALRPTPTAATSPSASPTATPAPTATPLPSITIAAGSLPTEPLPIDTDGFRLIDPTTGGLGDVVGPRLDNDVVFRAAGGDGWRCVCFRHVPLDASESVEVTVRHLDANLNDTGTYPIATYESITKPLAQDFGVRFDLVRSLDGRKAFLAIGQRSIDRWTVQVDSIDLERGELVASATLAKIDPLQLPAPTPSGDGSTDSYLGGPMVRLSPDGERLLVIASVDTIDVTSGEAQSQWYGWVAAAGSDGSADGISDVQPLDHGFVDRLSQCGWLAWLGPEEVEMTCRGASPSGDAFEVRSTDLAGRQTGAVRFQFGFGEPFQPPTEPLVDSANRIVYLWEGYRHVLHRLDLRDGTSAEIDVNPARGATPAIATPIPGIQSLTTLPPVWTRVTSDYTLYSAAQLVGEPGGTRLFALGSVVGPNRRGGDPLGSSGIWVFDTRTFANVDNWRAAAAYNSIALSPDGRWLTAAGQAGADVAGNPAGWNSSVSVHDTVDGRLVLQLGDLGESPVFTLP